MKFYIITLIINTFFFIPPANASFEVEQFCNKLGGQMEKTPRDCISKNLKFFKSCVLKNNQGETFFFDGCSGPIGKFKKLFLPYCLSHDLCYHHEPATSGKSRKECDLEFRRNLFAVCDRERTGRKCLNMADSVYHAVRTFGSIPYKCTNTKANYEEIIDKILSMDIMY